MIFNFHEKKVVNWDIPEQITVGKVYKISRLLFLMVSQLDASRELRASHFALKNYTNRNYMQLHK
jgi:hypothetical protein